MNRQARIVDFLLLAHELAAQRLRVEPALVQTASQRLARWRLLDPSNTSDSLRDVWERWLALPADELTRQVCARTDLAQERRSVSPMSALITQSERTGLLKLARSAA